MPLKFRIGGQSKISYITASVSKGLIDTPSLIVLTQDQRGSAVSLEKEHQVNLILLLGLSDVLGLVELA